jgi:predicted dehydrogenase
MSAGSGLLARPFDLDSPLAREGFACVAAFTVAMHRRHFITATLAAASTQLHAETPKTRIAVIGHTGHGNYGHGIDTMWLKMPETEIVAVADADAAGLATELKKLGVQKGYADYRTMLAEARAEIVAIGPRHIDQHHDMVLAAIAAGARGIYMEKPLCRSLVEADELVAACEAKGVRLSIAHRNRFHPVLPVIEKLIAEGLIGRVLEMRARGKEDARGGSLDLWVLGSHLFNLACVFGGPPVACSAFVAQGGHGITKADVHEGDEGIGPLAGDEVHARFEMQRGFPLHFDSVKDAGSKTAGFGLQIIGTEGIIDFRIDKEPLAHLLAGSPFNPANPEHTWVPITTAGVGKPEPIAKLGEQLAAHVVAARDLLDAVQQGREPLCSASEARITLEMISAVFESHRLNGQRVTLPLKTRVNPMTLL